MPAHNKKRGQRGGRGATADPANPPAPQQASYDGPPESPGRGRSGSVGGGPSVRASSRGASQTRLVDPARDPPPAPVLVKNVDFGGQAYDLFSKMPTELAKRDGKFGKLGKKAPIEVNSHLVTQYPTKDVFQYDIVIGSGVEKRGLITAVWMSKAVQSKLGPGFIFDGNKIGWAPRDLGELRITVDLDAEKGQTPREGRENVHRVRIAKVNNKNNGKVRVAAIQGYLEGKTDFDTSVLEAINFLDHLLRESPSKRLINRRRSYFARTGHSQDRVLLGGGVEAMKGIYQTIRMAEGRRLVVNADVSNSCFWHESLISQLAFELSGRSTQMQFMGDILPQKDGRPGYGVQVLKRLAKNKFIVKHRGQLPGAESKTWTITRVSNKNAKTHMFDVKNKETGKVTTESVFSYYQTKYNVRIDKWQLPLLETQKRDVMFPMELAIMAPAQQYPFKLNETQTANMIKFAVSRPPVRRAAIKTGLDLLDWSGDQFLKGYGLKIDNNMLKTTARIMDPPEVLFAKNATAKPLYSGRWDLRGKVFYQPNTAPLKSWGICVLVPKGRSPHVSQEQVSTFKQSFLNLYRGHGGNVVEKDPVVIGGIADDAEALNQCFMKAGSKANARPQMILVILPDKSSDVYQRVKRNCDCRFGVMSQCVQATHVIKNAPQYCSNVLMKFNCKLGGTTSAIKVRTPYFSVPTMIIGADVSHAAPGLEQASMAAMTVSLDKTCSRYGAAVESNGHRVEMITGENIGAMLRPLVDWWQKNVGGGRLPKHVYYFRDGVSEGQYIPLLKYEVADIKLVFEEMGQKHPDNMPKFTVVVAEKRHHIRFFPPNGPAADKNGNPVPGVIVDHDVTSPFENDVYLCSHAAIQGTARPTHYTTIMDEANVDTDKFQAMLYEHCYQYQRATTPVSLFPAVYYAHLASKRGESHINMAADKRQELQEQRRKQPGVESKSHSDEMKSQTEWPKLMPFDTRNQMHLGMWYI